MWKVILLSILLSGCANQTVIPPVEVPIYHPSMPIPYSVCNIYLEVLEDQDRAKVAMSYNDNVTVAICNKDMERYLRELINITCSYRQELKESICIDNR